MVLRAAAELQKLVPGSVLVRGSADADHVLTDLRTRFASLLEFLEGRGDWVTHRTLPPKLILGDFLGVETGLRQLIRSKPLETTVIDTASGPITVPTPDEMLRIKSWLVIQRNATRDYIDVAALATHLGDPRASAALSSLDECYLDVYRPDQGRDVSPLLQLARQLADPIPHDLAQTDVANYKGIVKPWEDWKVIRGRCRALAVRVTETLS